MKLVPYTGHLADYTGIMHDATSRLLCPTLTAINGTSLPMNLTKAITISIYAYIHILLIICSEKFRCFTSLSSFPKKLLQLPAYYIMFKHTVTKIC